MTVQALVIVAILLVAVPSAWPCSVLVSKLTAAVELVQQAEVIVKARADGLSAQQGRPDGLVAITTQVEFSVLAVLKGPLPATRIAFNGWLAARDEPNGRSVPYPSVRPSGLAGSCFAVGYRKGAEYLLFLKKSAPADKLTPYWAPLAPSNEQLFGRDDPWEAWVRGQLRNSPRRRVNRKREPPNGP